MMVPPLPPRMQPRQMLTPPAASDGSKRVIGGVLWTLGVLIGGILLFVIFLLPPAFSRDPVGNYTNMFIAAALAFPACFVYLWVPVIIDRYDPEPLWALTLAFVWGAVAACGFAGLINSINGEIGASLFGDDAGEFVASVCSAPFVEEGFKGIFVLSMLWFFRREFDGVVDGVVYATFVALGFAATENVIYYSRSLQSGGAAGLVATFGIRGILAPWGHPLYTSMTGIGVGIARETTKGWLKVCAPVGGYLCAVFLHATWNGSAFLSDAIQVPIFYLLLPLWLLFVLAFLVVLVFLVRREGQIIRRNLQDEVLLGNLSRDELELVCSPWGRMRALFSKGGIRGRKFVDAASRLGLSKWHAARAMQGQKRTISADFIVPLRQELYRLRQEIMQGR